MTSAALTALLGSTAVTVRPWWDPVVESRGHDACGDYVELFWLGTLGPTATWLLRRLALVLVRHPMKVSVHITDLALGVGLGSETGSRRALVKSLGRLEMFGLVRAERDHLLVRAVVPPLPTKQLARLPNHLRHAHALWREDDPAPALAAAYGRPA